VIGVLGILDAPKLNAKSTVLALKTAGIDVWMCTGDHEETAQAIARAVCVEPENVCANVSPQGKADLVTRLQRRKRDTNSNLNGKKGKIAMVGDGINDSVALARADVGIAIGAGTEVAMEAANVVLVRSNLHDVFVVLHLSKFVFNRIKINLMWATGYNLFALPFAAGCFFPWTDWTVPPAFAGFMMAFSSVSVVTSSLLLKTYRKPIIQEDGTIQDYGCISFVSRVQSILYKCLAICPNCKGHFNRGWTTVETSNVI
jgi:ATPase, P-type (transporting), HAD superfamily, subfamily IC